MTQFPEDALAELLKFVRGEWIGILGPGITTHGDMSDNTHLGLLELERRGLVYRKQEFEHGAVLWMPVELSSAAEIP